MPRTVLSILLLALIVAACGDTGSSPGATATSSVIPSDAAAAGGIEGAWQAVTVAGQPVVPGHEPRATFAPTEVTGTTGCNSFGGSYTYADGTIAFGPLRQTLMGCIGPIGEVEGRFSAALTGATTASIDADGRLTIDGTAGAITFVVARPQAGG
jgi:heat shock protein HslJ